MHPAIKLIVAALFLISTAYAQTVSTLVPSVAASGGVSLGPDGNIYVANFGDFLSNPNGNTVFRVTPQGDVSVFATGFAGASGNAWNSQDVMFQANIGGNRIDQVTLDGVRSTFVTSGIVNPVGVAIDAQDNVYVANCGNNTIQRVTPQGVSTTLSADPRLSCPNGLTIDPDGNLYTANFNNGNVLRITQNGDVSVVATTPSSTFRPGGGNGHLTFANGVLYVASNASSQIFAVTLDGQMSVVAGDGSRGHNDGDAAQASFSFPNGITASADGRFLYFNESESTAGTVLNGNTFPLTPNRVRVIDLGPLGEPFDFSLAVGAWLNPNTDGEGILFDYSASLERLFGTWFTFTLQAVEPVNPPAMEIGFDGQRWMTTLMTLNGNTASGPLRARQGGAFDMPPTASESSAEVGQFTVEFSACDLGHVTYTIDSANVSGAFDIEPLEKVVNPDGFSCGGNPAVQ